MDPEVCRLVGDWDSVAYSAVSRLRALAGPDVAFAPARGIGVCAAINAFDVAAGLAMAKTANDLIAELAPR